MRRFYDYIKSYQVLGYDWPTNFNCGACGIKRGLKMSFRRKSHRRSNRYGARRTGGGRRLKSYHVSRGGIRL